MALFKKYILDDPSTWGPGYEKLSLNLLRSRNATKAWFEYLESPEVSEAEIGGPGSNGARLCAQMLTLVESTQNDLNAWAKPFEASNAQGKSPRFVLCRYAAETQLASSVAIWSSTAATYKYRDYALFLNDPQLENAQMVYAAAKESLQGAAEMVLESGSFRDFQNSNNLAQAARGFSMANNFAGVTREFLLNARTLMSDSNEYWLWLKGEANRPTPNYN